MKKAIKNRRPRAITRREFVGGLAAAGIVTGAPALLRGRNLNDKLNIAFIGCGGRGLTNINELTIRPRRRCRSSRRPWRQRRCPDRAASGRERGRAL